MMENQLLTHILSYLDAKELSRVACVNKRLLSVASSDDLWETLFHSRWGSLDGTSTDVDWKSQYINHATISRNWVQGKYKVESLLGHRNSVRTITFTDQFIYTGSSDKTIKIWDIKENTCIRTVAGRITNK
jgi:WD40 repeat protein